MTVMASDSVGDAITITVPIRRSAAHLSVLEAFLP